MASSQACRFLEPPSVAGLQGARDVPLSRIPHFWVLVTAPWLCESRALMPARQRGCQARSIGPIQGD